MSSLPTIAGSILGVATFLALCLGPSIQYTATNKEHHKDFNNIFEGLGVYPGQDRDVSRLMVLVQRGRSTAEVWKTAVT
ncbi:hypothetical protein BJY01DRAFT_202698 [Aspergillus pseudoustus]|uniref:Uncharacterized protein n=1 Tax=Aspergillus pseudoustus TaxID=1810923 RepID=A0ABR4KXN3_9EURO